MRDYDRPSFDDAELVRRARSADRDAFASLVRRHQGAALRLATALAPAGEAEDAVQDAFVKAYRSLARFDETRPFRPWLIAIVANETRSRGRKRGRLDGLVERAAALAPPDAGESPQEQALARVGAGPLVAALATLGRGERQTVVLRYVLDLSEEETAALWRLEALVYRLESGLGRDASVAAAEAG